MKKLLLICLALALAAGCAGVKSTGSGGSIRLETGQMIMVVMPADGVYNGKTYANSGQETANRLRTVLLSKASEVAVSKARADVKGAIKEGQAGGFRYIIYPEITHWEHRASTWSGRPTRISFFITVYDLKTPHSPVLQQNIEGWGAHLAIISESMFRQFMNEVF